MTLYFLRERTERPEEWVPEEANSFKYNNNVDDEYAEILQVDEDESQGIVDIFSIHSANGTGNSLLCLKYRNEVFQE